jgi:protoheme IX farnesyltransferase
LSRTEVRSASVATAWRDYWQLTKPRVVALIVLTSLVGSLLAVPGLPPIKTLLLANLGIALAAGSAAAFNQVLDRGIHARMRRTRARPLCRESRRFSRLTVSSRAASSDHRDS